MFKFIKGLLRHIFPMPIDDTERHIETIENVIGQVVKQQQIQIERIDNIQKQALEQQKLQQMITDNVYQKVLQKLQSQFEETIQVICRNRCASDHKIDELSEQLHQVKEMWTNEAIELNLGIHDIREGDLFRRIEYLQSKLGDLEYLIQSNLLDIWEQRKSSDWEFLLRMRALFPLMSVDHSKGFSRIGKDHDGGYVMVDDFDHRKIAYSFGIANDISWDLGIAARGLDVYMYDHTIDGLPEKNEHFLFSKIGLCAENKQTEELKSLSDILMENGHSNEYGMILKCDIEGAEWDVLCNIDKSILEHFSQIVFEFHGLTLHEKEKEITEAMLKLNETHQLVHIHANNYGKYLLLGGIVMPDLLECTYLLRKEYRFKKNIEGARKELDQANNQYIPDIFLGAWDFLETSK